MTKQAVEQAQLTIPAIGDVWPGQGGIYAGFMPARGSAEGYHMILGDDIGEHEWSPYGDESPATSLTDGRANTQALVESGAAYPAAIAAHEHQADGHADFYLPAPAELYEIWLNLNGKIRGWAWSSAQRSAYSAFNVHFEGGFQDSLGKSFELVVRPLRRFIR